MPAVSRAARRGWPGLDSRGAVVEARGVQVVGFPCQQCSEVIATADAGTWCARCGDRFHLSCAVNDRCSTCNDLRTRPEDVRVTAPACIACSQARRGNETQCVCGATLSWDDAREFRADVEALTRSARRAAGAGVGLLVGAVALAGAGIGVLLVVPVTRAAVLLLLVIGFAVTFTKIVTSGLRSVRSSLRIKRSLREVVPRIDDAIAAAEIGPSQLRSALFRGATESPRADQ